MKLVKVPAVNSTGKTDGCEGAPAEIVKALRDIFTNESGVKPDFSVSEVKVNSSDIEETNKSIFKSARKVLQAGPAVFVGGDHSISYSLVRAFCSLFWNPGIVIFDAHPDCVHNFNPPTHEDWLRVLIEEGKIKPENVILVGMRNVHRLEKQFLNSNKLNVFSSREIAFEGVHEIADAITTTTKKFDALYLSIDIDVCDPAFAPGTFYREPGGLASRELLYFLQRLRAAKNFHSADVVEVNPKLDKDGLTVKLAAKIVSEFVR